MDTWIYPWGSYRWWAQCWAWWLPTIFTVGSSIWFLSLLGSPPFFIFYCCHFFFFHVLYLISIDMAWSLVVPNHTGHAFIACTLRGTSPKAQYQCEKLQKQSHCALLAGTFPEPHLPVPKTIWKDQARPYSGRLSMPGMQFDCITLATHHIPCSLQHDDICLFFFKGVTSMRYKFYFPDVTDQILEFCSQKIFQSK